MCMQVQVHFFNLAKNFAHKHRSDNHLQRTIIQTVHVGGKSIKVL